MPSVKEFAEEIKKAGFEGWDFSYIQNRVTSAEPAWSYRREVESRLLPEHTLLDMGTGGGELLSSFNPLPLKSYATECYKPNVPIAKARLEPLGVQVCYLENEKKLPYQTDFFDFIINKHESFSASEVFRVLKPGGVFLTQQVGSKDLRDLNKSLGDNSCGEFQDWHLAKALQEIKKAGFEVSHSSEAFLPIYFEDIGAVLFYLNALPWQVEGFSVDKFSAPLEVLNRKCESEGGIEFTEHRFYFRAKKRG